MNINQQKPDQEGIPPDILWRALANFRARLAASEPHPEGFVEVCLKYPPWTVYEFGMPPRMGLVLGMGVGQAGYTATLAVLHKHNPSPPLFYERKVSGVSIEDLRAVGVDRDELARWVG